MSDSLVPWIFSLVFTPVGTVLGVVMYRKIRRNRTLLRTGASAQGVVTDLQPTRMQSPGSEGGATIRSHGTLVYYPVISWTTADGQSRETRTDIARPREKTLAVGTRVEVRYDPANPSHWTLPAESNTVWWVFTAMGALFAAIGLGSLIWALLALVL
ncbi:DUF3592 domain-containing protein [Streptomyces botrytidirepellens]|uniref:DUF3592 domain-containing protein n=1 Tax=Streptomyces botrytidirepellens TaxID=2486417 RepID=A0A3M8VKZ0_9ACTN|nr:DUF3592 domain-containing protein [Streptomyces botrytidirepellens]RNG18318.1 DUF3592 domain-containing protein [Streptomyces botrytidirepellens]